MKRTSDSLRRTVEDAVRATGQSSYSRRAPAPESVRLLHSAKDALCACLSEDPENVEAWHLLSLVDECLLDYPAAIASLKRRLALSTDRKCLKKLALLKEAMAFWEKLMLSPTQLRDLGAYLERRGTSLDSPRTLDGTIEWLDGIEFHDAGAVISALEDLGAFSDFQVLENVVRP